MQVGIQNKIKHRKVRHSRESGNPDASAMKMGNCSIAGRVRNDKLNQYNPSFFFIFAVLFVLIIFGESSAQQSCSTDSDCYFPVDNCRTNYWCDQNLKWCMATYKDCEDGDPCTINSCNSSTGNCESKPFVCADDGNACTEEYCDSAAGQCVSKQKTCDDNNLCTTDKCNQLTGGCINIPKECDDGNPCTVDACNAATGQCNNELRCDDGNLCTTDSCDPTTGICSNLFKCDDENPCTIDGCEEITGRCTSLPKCDDDNNCTVDSCDPSTGVCSNEFACDDKNPCTIDGCDPATGKCTSLPKCDDDDKCTVDSCDPSTGVCSNEPSCKPDNPCEIASCNLETGQCTKVSTCVPRDKCEYTICLPSTGECIYKPRCKSDDPCMMAACDLDTGQCNFTKINCPPPTCDEAGGTAEGGSCPPPGGSGKTLSVGVFSSMDPNEKVGSIGTDNARYISGEEPLRYSIFFENLSIATAPAQEVSITDQLDTARMDLSTFSLGPIGFGDQQVIPVPGQTEYHADIDLRPDKNLIVRIDVKLSTDTGVLTYSFKSIDPDTGELPEDSTMGFLPPNVNPPEGEGSVLFTVMPKEGLSAGTEIRNRASIVFDVNAPIETNEWINTIDSDSDRDGYIRAVDCDDTNPAVNSGAKEVCDGVDNNCNGQIDEGFSNTYYRDADGDGYGNSAVSVQGCTAPAGYVSNNTDCNDNDLSIHPGASDTNCDGADNNCDGQVDEGYVSTPTSCGVGVCASTGELSCQRGRVIDTCIPGLPQAEVCDGIDNDCDGEADKGDVCLSFKDVTGLVGVSTANERSVLDRRTNTITSTADITITNTSSTTIKVPIHAVVIVSNSGVTMPEASGKNADGNYYYDLGQKLGIQELRPSQSATFGIKFVRSSTIRFTYQIKVYGMAP